MGRQRRPHLPGAIFHLTARTLRKERWFSPELRTATVSAIAELAPRSRLRLLAVAVMSNHLHIVAQQGDRPLKALMQPLLRRLALRIQTAHRVEGPVFWRPYGSTPCLNPLHARNAIVYSHLNPVRAGLCDDPADYRWTTHDLYADGDPPQELGPLASMIDLGPALALFATRPSRSRSELREDYRALVAWRMEADSRQEAGHRGIVGAPESAPQPDAAWGLALSPLFHSPVRKEPGVYDDGPGPFVPDLAALARATLESEAPGLTLASIRGRGGGARATRVRHAIIRRLHAAGYRNVQIARFLDLSESAVSYVLRK